MNSITKIIAAILCLTLTVAIVAAQDVDCAALAQKTIESAREACPEIGLNQACYGSPTIEIEPRDNVRLAFSKPGDAVDLSNLKSLTTYAFDSTAGNWGLAFANVRADLLNGGLSWLIFGDVNLQNESEAPSDFVALDVTVTFAQGANVRAQPSPDVALVKTLNNGDVVKAVGRLADGSWIRLLDGWVSTDLIHSADDLSRLKILAADASVTPDIYGAMQTFRFHSGTDDAPCAGVPDSGILIQSPDISVTTTIVANGAPLLFSGTLYLQTTAEGKTIISLLEGNLTYDSDKILKTSEKLQYGYQGETVIYEKPDDYDFAHARFLPLQLLPREFELPFSLGGVILPFTPGTGFLNGIAPDAACTVAWIVDVNIRSGPGTSYPIRRGVSSGFYALPDARAIGTDGAVWWRLADGIWLAANNTAAAGDCGNLPLVEPPPLPAN